MKNRLVTIAILLFVFMMAFFLRTLYLKEGNLTFGYDQARDATNAIQISNGDFKIQGPPSSAPGLFHGVLWYYFLSPAYSIGDGNPIFAGYYLAFFNALTVFLVFGLTYHLTNKSIAKSMLASLLFAISFEATQYATWLSNPTLGVITVPLVYLGLWLWVNKLNKYAPIITAIGLGLSIQSEIFLAYHIVPLLIWLTVYRNNIQKSQILTFVSTFSLSLVSFLLCEFKFGFSGIEGVKNLLIGENGNLAYAKSLGDFIILYLNQVGRIFAFNSFPINIGYGGGFVIGLIIASFASKKVEKIFLSSWLLSHLSVVSVGGVSTPFLMVGIGPAVSILIALYLLDWYKNGYKILAILIFIILIIGNLTMIFKENKKGSTLFSIQNEMTIKNQLAAIDYTYKVSDKKLFTVNSLTSPLYINIVWSYLYNWYGNQKYGYVPTYHGRDQIGQINKLADYKGETTLGFLIIEPMGGIPVRYLDEVLNYQDDISKLIEEKNWGELRVQKRNLYVKK